MNKTIKEIVAIYDQERKHAEERVTKRFPNIEPLTSNGSQLGNLVYYLNYLYGAGLGNEVRIYINKRLAKLPEIGKASATITRDLACLWLCELLEERQAQREVTKAQ